MGKKGKPSCCASAERLVCCQHGFSHKSKAQHHTGCYGRSSLHPNQSQYDADGPCISLLPEMLKSFPFWFCFFLSLKNLSYYFECQTWDVSKDFVDGEPVSQRLPQHLAQVSSHFQLFAQAPGRSRREAKPLSLILIFKAIYTELQLRQRGRGRQHKFSAKASGTPSNWWGSSKLQPHRCRTRLKAEAAFTVGQQEL